jgi:hypothetical protein
MSRILKEHKILMILVIIFFIVCIEYVSRISNNNYEPIYLYPEDFLRKKVITVHTNNETYKVAVRPGQNLSQIVQSILRNYLIKQGFYNEYEEFDFTNAIYSIVSNTRTKSGNPDLIYIGETLFVVLPKTLTIFKKISMPSLKFYDLEKLKKTLNSLKWLKSYSKDTWDCSNMSGFLAQYLIQEGWDAYIVSGQKYGGQHSWVQVRISPGKDLFVDIETTGIFIDKKSPKPSSRRYRPWEKSKSNPAEYGWFHLTQPLMGRR